MIKFKYFYIIPSVQKEIENALLETIDYPTDERVKNKHLTLENNLESVRLFLLTANETHTDFEVENKDEEDLKNLRLIRGYFLSYIRLKQNEMSLTSYGVFQTEHWIDICEMVILYKNMITNPDYGLTMWFKSFILKNLEFLKENGLITSFLVVCEFCPDFVTDDCYPIISKEISSTSLRACSSKKSFIKLLNIHSSKWKKYMVPQLTRYQIVLN